MKILGEEINEETLRAATTSQLIEAIAGAVALRMIIAPRELLGVTADATQLAKEADVFALEKLAKVVLDERIPVPRKPMPGSF